MIRVIGRLVKASVKATKVTWLWDKAIDAASRNDQVAALSYLRRLYQVFDAEIPSDKVWCDINILSANVACKLGYYDLSVSAATIALRQLTGRTRDVSNFDKDYLRYFCQLILAYCEKKGKMLDLPPDLWPIGVKLESLQPKKVRRDLVRNFPI
jgi:hypothetical protein